MTRSRFLNLILIITLAIGWAVPIPKNAVAAYPPHAIESINAMSWCVAGGMNGWNNNLDHLVDDGTQGDLVAGDGIFSLDYTVATAGRYEWKVVECNNWGVSYPVGNAWMNTSSTNQVVKFTFDTNDHAADAGWALLPATNIINVTDDLPTSFTAVGDFQVWNNADPATLLSFAGNGIYYLRYTIPTAGAYIGKVTTTGTWDAYGADGRSLDAVNLNFTTTSANQEVVFILNAYTGRVQIFTHAAPASGNWCMAGSVNGWNNNLDHLLDDGTQGDLVAGDGIFSLDYTVATAGRYEWKVVECGNWGIGYPAANAWMNTSTANQVVKFTFDTNDHAADAGWALLPANNIVNVTDDPPTSLTAVGDFQGWNNSDPATLLSYVGSGLYALQYTIPTAGSYVGKVVKTGSWDAFGADGRSMDAQNLSFMVQDNNDIVPFILDAATGRVGIFPPVELSLEVFAPVEGLQSAVADIEVTGFVLPVADTTVQIDLNGTTTYEPVVQVDGSFTQALTLVWGANTITITATNGSNTRTEIRHVTYGASHDDTIWWNELGHDSRSDTYRTPGGAVPTGTPVLLRLRAASGDLTAAQVRLYNDRTNTQSFLNMTLVADDGTYEWWQAAVPISDLPTVYWYRFLAIDGTDTDYYEDDGLRTGGWGMVYDESEDASYQLTVYDPAFQTPDWIKDAIVYQVFPDRFRDGDPANNTPAGTFFYNETGGTVYRSLDPEGDWNTVVCDPRDTTSPCAGTYSKNFYGGDLQGLTEKLDYLKGLGVNTIYLNPIFESPSNHKYDTTDYMQVDDAFGGNTAFNTLVTALEGRGMHLILDGVFNHTSSDSIFFDRYGRYTELGACESPDSPYRDWYYFYAPPAGTPGVCVGDDGTPNALLYESWFGFDSLPKLRANSQEVRDLIWALDNASVAPYWIYQGAKGWRLDVGGDVDPGTTNDPSNDYWEGFRDALLTASPDPQPYIVGEEWGNASSWTIGGEWDATMNYQYSTAMLGLWVDRAFFDNDHNYSSSAGVIEPLMPSQLDERLHNWQERYAPEAFYAMMNLLGSHDTSRALFMLDKNTHLNDESLYLNPDYDWSDAITRLKGVVILQMTLPGAPTIYYGDEIGLVGPPAYANDKWEDDPYNRQPYPWMDETGKPFYTHLQSAKSTQLLYDYYALLTATRNAHPALRTGSFDTLLVDDPSLVYAYGRKMADHSDAAIVIVNRHDTAYNAVLDLEGYLPSGLSLVNVLDSDKVYTLSGDGVLTITIPPMTGAVLVSNAAFAQAPAPVTDLEVTAEGDKTITLGWTAAVGATEYEIYRSLLDGGGYEWIDTASTNAYDDADLVNGIPYYYVVVAKNSTTGLESDTSNQASGIPHPAIGWANLQWPPTITHEIGILPTIDIYGQVWIDGYTNLPGVTPGLLAQVGFGAVDSAPATWTNWVDAEFNTQAGNNDEFKGQLLPEAVGIYEYVYRYSTTGGRDWFYADLNGPITDPSTAAPNPGVLTVLPSGDTTAPAAPANLHVTSQSATEVALAWDAVPDADMYAYDLYRSEDNASLGIKIARLLAPTTSYHDTDVVSGVTYYYVVQALDTSFNFSLFSNQVTATPAPRLVNVHLSVSVPDYTPAGSAVYFSRYVNPDGTVGGWDAAATLLTPIDATTYSKTLSILEGTLVEFKFTRGTWDTVEKGSLFEEIANRQLLVEYGTDGNQNVNLAVENWRDPIVADFSPADGAKDVPTSASVVVYWSRAMTDSSTFEVKFGDQTVSGLFTYNDADYSLMFTPTEPLEYLATYTVSVSGQISESGDYQQVPVSWTFTTGLPPHKTYFPMLFK